jgi:hypothetical protein
MVRTHRASLGFALREFNGRDRSRPEQIAQAIVEARLDQARAMKARARCWIFRRSRSWHL